MHTPQPVGSSSNIHSPDPSNTASPNSSHTLLSPLKRLNPKLERARENTKKAFSTFLEKMGRTQQPQLKKRERVYSRTPSPTPLQENSCKPLQESILHTTTPPILWDKFQVFQPYKAQIVHDPQKFVSCCLSSMKESDEQIKSDIEYKKITLCCFSSIEKFNAQVKQHNSDAMGLILTPRAHEIHLIMASKKPFLSRTSELTDTEIETSSEEDFDVEEFLHSQISGAYEFEYLPITIRKRSIDNRLEFTYRSPFDFRPTTTETVLSASMLIRRLQEIFGKTILLPF